MPEKKNLIGNIYGEFKVIEMLYNYNNTHKTYCKCIGINDSDYKEYIIRQDALQSGATVSTKGACKSGKKYDLTGQRFGMLTVIEPFGSSTSGGHLIWKCLCDCGQYSYPNQSNLIRGQSLSCGCRHSSQWEDFISKYLKSLHINFQIQKRFDACRNASGSDMLPFDFYIPELNIIIEYDGLHHFKPVKGWGGEDKFKITQQNDKIKNEYCKENGIELIRIPYTCTKEEIIQIINDIMRPATITA